jgi:hypothetical protein
MKGVGKFFGSLVFFTAIYYILWPFVVFLRLFLHIFPVLVYCTKKNLANLPETRWKSSELSATVNELCLSIPPRACPTKTATLFVR